MIIAPTNKYGIDIMIYDIQTILDSSLGWDDTNIYGRVKRVLHNDSYIPAYNYSENKETPEVFINDKVNGSIGFYVKSRDYSDWMHSANVDIIFTLDLSKLSITDEYAISYAEKKLRKTNLIKDFGAIKEGVDKVFSDFNTDRIKYRDMYPFCVFSFETIIYYSSDTNDC